MKETIRFRGLSLNKDEQSAQHGELALCGNVELHDGALRPYQVDGTLLAGGRPLQYSFPDQNDDILETVTCELLYIHTTAAYTHYISIARSTELDPNVTVLCWSYEDGDDWVTDKIANFDASDIRDIKSVGNTLCIMCGNGLHYILCKNDSGWGYKYLGQQPPFLELQFNLHNDSESTDNENRDVHIFNNPTGDSNWTDENGVILESVRASVTDFVMSKINQRIQEYTGRGYFLAPFFIRYCYRMYDGKSLIMHSPPVLMMPMLNHPAMTLLNFYNLQTRSRNAYTFYSFMLHTKLQIKMVSGSAVLNELREWSDIIESVDIFVTPQFSRINTADTIESLSVNYTDFNLSLENGHKLNIPNKFYDAYEDLEDNSWYSFDLPEYSDEQYFERIGSASSFFKLTSYSIQGSTFPTSFADVSFEEGILPNISVREQMTDDYKTHNILKPVNEDFGGMYVYNHRLNVYGISEVLFEGFSPSVMFPFVASDEIDKDNIAKVSVYVQTDYGLRLVEKVMDPSPGYPSILTWMTSNGYCFYPDSRAIAIKFTLSSGITPVTSRVLKSHPSLNGARSFLGDGNMSLDFSGTSNTDRVIPLTNKVYTSRADNPFYFPNLPGESGINSVGTGNIIGIAGVTRPLVQGEVGRQNLVVFATDGIWVLEVSPTGTYQSMRNLSREVCVNKESICQMDQSILFATNRSLSRFVESDVVSVSDVLDGPIFDVKTKMAAVYSYLEQNHSAIKALAEFSTPPLDFFREGRELYDYTGSRVLVFPDSLAAGGVALVYSIRDGAWSTIVFPGLKTVVNSYPSPYIEKADGAVLRMDRAYDYYGSTQQHFTPGVIVTRTLTFSDTMDVVRGFRQYTDAETMPLLFFYGSNDQRTWVYIGRSSRSFSNYMPGHPYRFFRVAMVLQMYPSEEYQQLELEIINKYAKL